MYYISKYMIVQDLNNKEKLLYSTLSTSILTLENEIYEDIFILKKFDDYLDICNELDEMGFLYHGHVDQQALELEKIRREIVDADHGITAITIAPTMECNARCYYCFEKGATRGTMSKETADHCVQFLIKNCSTKELYISWFGGEPLVAIDIIDRINSQLLEAGIKIESTITTNGLLIDENVINKMKIWNVQRVQITLDGLNNQYDRIKNYITNIEYPFERIMENIELLIQNHFNIHLRVNYKSNNEKEVRETMNYLHQRFGYYENLYLYGAPLDLPEIKGYSEFDKNEGDIFFKVLHMSLDNGYENDELNFSALSVSKDYNVALGEFMLAPFPAPCFMVNQDRFAIDDQGLLYKCQKHLGKAKYNCGNIVEGIIKNDIYKYYCTEKIHDHECINCFMLPICQGGCNANRVLYGHKFACPPSKSIAPQLVKAYYDYLIQNERRINNENY